MPPLAISARAGLGIVVAALLLAGCGDGDDNKLDRGDPQRLADARARLDDAIDTEETLRTDKTEARRLERIVAASQLSDSVPSLVDQPARADFLHYAPTDPARALHRPAASAVATIAGTLDGKKRSERIKPLSNQTVESYLREAERDTKPIWPDLAKQLSEVSVRD
jgi:hypothetical protein